MLGICPDVTLVDITHEIPPHDVLDGALQLAATYRYFPAGTIFLVVVDPGVGSARRGIAAEAGDYRFVAPDNGVLTAVLRERPAEARRRADRAAIRAADREPHVRRARPLRAGRRVARQGHPAVGARPDRRPTISSSRFRSPRSPTTHRWARSCASIASAISSPTSIGARSRRSRTAQPSPRASAATPIAGVVATYAESARARSARSSAAPITSRSRSTAGARRPPGRRARRAVIVARVIRCDRSVAARRRTSSGR